MQLPGVWAPINAPGVSHACRVRAQRGAAYEAFPKPPKHPFDGPCNRKCGGDPSGAMFLPSKLLEDEIFKLLLSLSMSTRFESEELAQRRHTRIIQLSSTTNIRRTNLLIDISISIYPMTLRPRPRPPPCIKTSSDLLHPITTPQNPNSQSP